MESSKFQVPSFGRDETETTAFYPSDSELGIWNSELSPQAETRLAVGVDLVEVARVRAAWERHGERFLRRVFTAREQADCRGRVASLAARFAAKEATAKALGTGIGRVRWRDIEVRTRASGQPELTLHAAAAAAARALDLHEWQVSLSHTRTLAVAFVVASGQHVARERSPVA